MKKSLFLFLMLAFSSIGFAQDDYVPEAVDNYVPEALADTVAVLSVDDIIKEQTSQSQASHTDSYYKKVWGRNTFFNISMNSTKFESKELPTANTDGTLGKIPGKFDNTLLGLQWGHTYNFHKKPIGQVLFIGLDYSWLDFNLSKFDSSNLPGFNFDKITDVDVTDVRYPLPWNHKMWMADYGMSLGPSLTLYPFTSLGKKGTDEIRLQLYFHVGYTFSGAIINDVEDVDELGSYSSTATDPKTKTEVAWGHGLFTSFGFNLTWKFVGLGYEVRNASNMKYKSVNSDFKTGDTKFEQTINRFYLQFRF